MQNCLRMSEPNQRESNSRREKGQLDSDKIESEILANERTFLAWVRTSIAVMSLGFVIARFSLWMREVATRVNPQDANPRIGPFSAPGRVHDRRRRVDHRIRRLALSCD